MDLFNDKKRLLYGLMIVLMLLCLFNMPYGYFELVRYIAMVAFGFLAYDAYDKGDNRRMIVMIALALLFQPFLKIALGRVIWVIVDILVALYMCFLLYKSIKEGKESESNH